MFVQLEEAHHVAEVAAADALRRNGIAHLTAQKSTKLQLRHEGVIPDI